MGSGPKSPNNEFVESGRKSQSKYTEKILVDSVKGKELLVHPYKKHLWICPNGLINNMKLFLFTVVFLPPFALFFSPFLFSCPPFSFNPFSCYILRFLYPFLYPRVSQVLGVFSVPVRLSLNLLLLAVRLLVYCSGITFTLIWPESQLGRI